MRKLLWLFFPFTQLFAGYSAYQTIYENYAYQSYDQAFQSNGGVTPPQGYDGPRFNGGSLISTLAVPDGSQDYDVRVTFTGSWGSVFLRSTLDNSSYYSAEIRALGANPPLLSVYKVINGSATLLASAVIPFRSPMTFRAAIRGSEIFVYTDNVLRFDINDTSLAAGQPGVGGGDCLVSVLNIGPLDRIAPSPVNSQAIHFSSSPTCIDLQWQSPPDDTNGIGVQRFRLDRNGAAIMFTNSGAASDCGLSPGTTYSYSFTAIDYHGNASLSSTTISASTLPAGTVEARRIGVHSQGAYWGAGGEQIDMRSGNLNFTVPLFKAIAYSGFSFPFGLNYNSQLWRKSADGTSWKLGADTGFGFGWRVMAGSITPLWTSLTTFGYFVFTDSTGAEYRLDRNDNGVWSSTNGTYVMFDSNTLTLYFPDGSSWLMGCISAGTEEDGGTMYPTVMQDVQGNKVSIQYHPGIGTDWPDSSSRIQKVNDVRASYTTYYGAGVVSYGFRYETTYTGQAPHLLEIWNNVGSGENFQFTYNSQTLTSPFSPYPTFGVTKTMANMRVPSGYSYFQYDATGAGELVRYTPLLGGWFGYDYRDCAYSSGSTIREVATRYLGTAPGATQQAFSFEYGGLSSMGTHYYGAIRDNGAQAIKIWWFDPAAHGLPNMYEDRDWNTTIIRQQASAWTFPADANPYVNAVTTILENGLQTRSEQTVDSHGNVTQRKIYGYGSGTWGPLVQTTDSAYLTDVNYTSRHIFNRLTSAVLQDERNDPNTGKKFAPVPLVQNTYDGYLYNLWTYYCGPQSKPYLGNLTTQQTPGAIRNIAYSRNGGPCRSDDGSGHITDYASNLAGYPTTITPYTEASLAVNLQWNSFLGLTQESGPNGATAGLSWAMIGRPSQKTSPHGALTTFEYNDNERWEKATTNGRWTKTWKDGLGRPVKVETGNAVTVSVVDTEYAPCACSPLGKVKRVSQPHAPTAKTIYWTEYVYDVLGRTVQVKHPDNSGVTTYAYSGNTVTVTGPTGKWKTYTQDALGQLVQVTEPNPGGGQYSTTYAYNPVGKLIRVEMPRDGVTQTRVFNYDAVTQRLMSATNPETGTVTYAYNGDGTLLSKTDAKGFRTEYTYDSKQRVTAVRIFNAQNVEQTCEAKNFTYDVADEYTQNGIGRVGYESWSGCQGGAFTQRYSYTAAGLPTKKRLELTWLPMTDDLQMEGTYEYDNEGRMTAENYPEFGYRNLRYFYDDMGRLSAMKDPSGTVLASAGYGVAGEILSLSYFGTNETRQYNNRFQMTRQTVFGVMDMEYRYSATNNDGRITSQKDNVSGEEVVYQYDALSRLIQAAASGPNPWTQDYTYDGFGNKLTHTGMPSLSYNANNQINAIHGWQYDLSGNATVMPWASLAYDGHNRVKQANTPTGTEYYEYAPDNKRIAKTAGGITGSYEVYFYNVRGQRIMGMTRGCTLYSCWFNGDSSKTNVYFLGRLVQAGGNTIVTDRLGSVRRSGGTSLRYYPYGEEQVVTASETEKFGTYFRDQKSNLDYADQRYYASGFGRFVTADPYVASGVPGNPGSWNRYAYVLGDPINWRDPAGLIEACPEGTHTGPDAKSCVPNGSGGGGGVDDQDPGNPVNYCALHPEDPMCGGKTPDDVSAEVMASTPIKNKSAAKGLLGDAVANIGKCGEPLRRKFGNDVFAKMAASVNDGQVSFYDARRDVDGSVRASELYPGSSDKTLGELTAHDNAMVLRAASGEISSIVVFGATFWQLDAKYQQRTLVHELLHAVVKVDDGDLGGSVGFQRWLNQDCPK